MEEVKRFFGGKLWWLGGAAVLGIVLILSLALLGPTVNPAPRNLPVALVVEDEGNGLTGAGAVNFGETIGKQLEAIPGAAGSTPLRWTRLASRDEAVAALDRQEYYAALIIPADTTKRLLSVFTPAPQPAQAELLLNQGKSATGYAMTSQVLEKAAAAMNAQLRSQFLAELQKRGAALTTAQASALAAPLELKETVLHPILAGTANGNAPVVLTQLVWMAALASSVIQLQLSRKARSRSSGSYTLLGAQLGSGLIYGLVAVSSLLLLNTGLIGLEVPRLWPTALFLYGVFGVFYLLQAALLQVLGMKGAPLLVLLFFFGLPVLSLPYELLPRATQSLFYSWVPFRFSAEGLRDLFYFGQGLGWRSPARVLGWIGLCSLAVLLLSPLAGRRRLTRRGEGLATGE